MTSWTRVSLSLTLHQARHYDASRAWRSLSHRPCRDGVLLWHDFSSNKGGDVFSFVMEVEGMDVRASLEHLARKASVDLSMYDTKGNQEIALRKKRLLLANELAASYYQQSLIKNPMN